MMNFWKAQGMKVFFTLIVFISTPLVHAQEAELLEEEQSTAAEPQEGGAEETDEVEGEEIIISDPNSEVRFIPTEQISQDLGVSFPVDI